MISVVVLTFNEAPNLPRCIGSVAFSDDVLVLDSGSTDDTAAVARGLGARVMMRPFDSFGRQRNFAMEEGGLQHEWVLHLDADEVVTAELRDTLLGIASTGCESHDGFRIPSKLMFMDRWLRHAGMYPAYQVRFGKRDKLRFVDHGHGQREDLPSDRVGTIDQPLDHHNFSKGLDDWHRRHRRYAVEEAAQALAERSEPLRASEVLAADATIRRRALKRLANRMPFRPSLRFAYAYLLRRGFLDGLPGFRYACMLATYQRYIDQEIRRLRSEPLAT